MALQIVLPGEKLSGTCVALGNFDGIHLGHAHILGACIASARENGLKSLVWTFREHPEAALRHTSPRLILSGEDKEAILDAMGADYLMQEDFARVRDFSPEEFCDKILIGGLGARRVFCGFNFSFGKFGAGNADFLRSYLGKSGIEVSVMEPVKMDGETVSSTAIRNALEAGEVEKAALLLGRRFFIHLPVEHGKRLGTKLGFPTVNQNFPEEYVIPRRGVYAVLVHVGEKEYPGVCNIGNRPTFDDGERVNAETHLIGFDGDLYGKKLKIDFYRYLRGEIRFSDAAALTSRIRQDEAEALSFFAKS